MGTQNPKSRIDRPLAGRESTARSDRIRRDNFSGVGSGRRNEGPAAVRYSGSDSKGSREQRKGSDSGLVKGRARGKRTFPQASPDSGRKRDPRGFQQNFQETTWGTR